MKHTKIIIAATALALGAGTAVYAKGRVNDAVADLALAKISLSQAVAAAEQHAGGQATRAELEHYKGKTAFEVEVVKAGHVSMVTVDATDGKVLAAKADRDDRHKHEKEDE